MTTTVKECFRNVPYMDEEEIANRKLHLDVFHPRFTPISAVNLDYKPIICLAPEDADEDGYHVENDGIGGSDAGAIVGLNERRSPRLAGQQKLGLIPREIPDAGLQYIFDFGHQMEIPLIALYAAKTGNEVWRDRAQYQHPFYPWMKADIDGFTRLKDGSLAILECKTFSSMPKVAGKWASGIYGKDGRLGHPEYIAQAYHNMAVMNINKMIFLANSGNNPDQLVVVEVNRDLEKEVELINAEGEFWVDLQKGIIPEQDEANADVYKSFVKGMARKPRSESKIVNLPIDVLDTISEIESLKFEKRLLEAEKTSLQDKINAREEELIIALGDAEKGFVEGYEITFKTGATKKVDADKLQLCYPDAYEDCLLYKENNPTLKIKELKYKR